jgi:micrococcal nuclease
MIRGKKMKLKTILILLLIAISGFGYYHLTGNAVYQQTIVNVTRVIDGDTIETDIGHIRLLGINTPEKKQPYYQEAKDFLINQIQGKQIQLELHGKDKYSRYLGYIFYNNKLINKKLIEQGFATLYYYDKDSHYEEMQKAEEEARKNEKGLWKKSSSYGCISIVSLEYKDGGDCKNQEQLKLNNKCEEINAIIKDDANHIYNENIQSGLFVKNYSCIWNDAGDTIYIRDSSGLILFWRY